MLRMLVAAAVAVAALVAAPSVAHAATLHQDGPGPYRVLLQDEPGETNLVSVEGSRAVVIRDINAPIKLARVPACNRLDDYAVRCSKAVRHIELDLGDGPDVATVDTSREVSLEGGAGNDRYVALATEAPSRVDFDGGIGLDLANYGFATAGVLVSVDLEAGDGRPGDDDRIRRDVETVLGSQFADVLVGSPRTEQLAGLDGDDQITGGTGAELLAGGEGNDRIDARDGAPDTIDCGGQLLDSAAVDLHAEAAVIRCAEIVF
jgi:hemolysin type calcium-binding protein